MQKAVIKSDNSIVVTAPVLIPQTPDCDYLRGEKLFTEEEILTQKEEFDSYAFVDTFHTIRDENSADKTAITGKPVKSYILTEDTELIWVDGSVHEYPKGTWMLSSEITDPLAIQQVENGTLNGWSPSIFPRDQAEKIKAALKASAGGLVKDISDPVTAVVSLVPKPCQQKNRLCKTNINGEIMSKDNTQSKLNAIKRILAGEEPEYALKEDVDALKTEFVSAFKSDEFKGLIQETVNECVVEALKEPALKACGGKKKKEDESVKSSGNAEEEGQSSKPDDEGEVEEKPIDEEEEGEEVEEKPAAKKDSKKLPQHDGGKPALKSDRAIILEGMGRDMKGRPKRQ